MAVEEGQAREVTVGEIANRLGVRPQRVRRAVRRLRGRTNNVGKGGRYSWPSFDHPEVRAVEQAIQRANDAPIEDPTEFQQLTVRLPKDLHVALRTLALARGNSMNDIVTRATVDYISDKGRAEEVRTYIKEAQEQFRVTLDKLKDL
jgi:hypothetical protein